MQDKTRMKSDSVGIVRHPGNMYYSDLVCR